MGHTPISLCRPAFLGILLDSLQEVITTSRMSNVLHTHMQPLLDISISNDFVDHHTDRALGDVENDARLAMVVLVRQTLLLSGIPDDINNISDFVQLELQG